GRDHRDPGEEMLVSERRIFGKKRRSARVRWFPWVLVSHLNKLMPETEGASRGNPEKAIKDPIHAIPSPMRRQVLHASSGASSRFPSSAVSGASRSTEAVTRSA